MQLLILGGTQFVGRHLVEAAIARGHAVTLFNRGTHPDLFPDVEQLRGDRDGNLAALQNRHWEAVIDTCGYVPRIVRASAELLAGAVDHYTFISTISVYSGDSPSNLDESSAVGALDDETVEEVTGETYGPLKVLCERAVERAYPDRALIIRPGLIVGPYDPTDRFTYWPVRVAKGGEVLAPGKPDQPVQFIDARDLAAWVIRLVESKRTGVYNAAGPDYRLSLQQMLDECRSAIGSDAHFTWVSESFLLDAGAAPWSEIPVWVPEAEQNVHTVNTGKAIAAGLTFRTLAATAQDTLAWAATRPPDLERRAGLKPEREAELLRAWHTQH